MNPEFFDYFGIPIFIALGIIGIVSLFRKKKLPTWLSWIIIIIAIFGVITDGSIIIKSLFLGG